MNKITFELTNSWYDHLQKTRVLIVSFTDNLLEISRKQGKDNDRRQVGIAGQIQIGSRFKV